MPLSYLRPKIAIFGFAVIFLRHHYITWIFDFPFPIFLPNHLWLPIMSASNSKIIKMRQTLGYHPRASSVASKDHKRSQCGIMAPIPVVSGAQPDETLSMLGGSFLDLQSKPNEVWCRRDTMMNSSAIGKQTIHSICTNELFPCVKFINRGYDVEFSENWKSICQFVLSRCNLSSETNQREFWVRNRKYVINTITTLRSNKSASLRWAFFGKLGLYFVYMTHISNSEFLIVMIFFQIGCLKQQKNHLLKSPGISKEKPKSSLPSLYNNFLKVGVILKPILNFVRIFCHLLERRPIGEKQL